MEKKEMKEYEAPSLEVLEIVCQNTPDWTHGNSGHECVDISFSYT